MSKNLVRKIIATLFFILSVFFIWQLYSEYPEIQSNNKMIIRFGALFLSILFLFVLIYTFQTEVIYEKEKKSVKEKEKDESKDTEIKIGQTERKIKNIISDSDGNLKGQSFSEFFLKAFAKEFHIVQGVVYVKTGDKFSSAATYAFYGENKMKEFSLGQGITGQTAMNKKIKQITDIPEGYINVVSGLGASSPKYLLLIPFVVNGETTAVVEFASFDAFPDDFEIFHSLLNNAFAKKFEPKE